MHFNANGHKWKELKGVQIEKTIEKQKPLVQLPSWMTTDRNVKIDKKFDFTPFISTKEKEVLDRSLNAALEFDEPRRVTREMQAKFDSLIIQKKKFNAKVHKINPYDLGSLSKEPYCNYNHKFRETNRAKWMGFR